MTSKSGRTDCQLARPSGWTMNPLRLIEVGGDGRMWLTAVYVAMSGGVDSSMAAALLKKKVWQYIIALNQGYNVIGVYMRNWNLAPETEYLNQCSNAEDWDDMQEVCRHLQIPCTDVSLRMTFLT
jgi:tRNA U34 2-thiouridine synthase MnmA/TrmU